MLARTIRPLQAAALGRAALSAQRTSPITARSFQTTSTSLSSPDTSDRVTRFPDHPPMITNSSRARAENVPQLPYHVTRTLMNGLPVYQRRKRGGSLEETLIRKIEGDIGALAADIAEGLGFNPSEVKTHYVTRSIRIKGHHKEKVTEFLKHLGV